MKRSVVKPLRFAALAVQTEIGGFLPRISGALRIVPLALCAALVTGSLLPLSTLARTVTVASCDRATGATTLSISAAEAGDGDKTLFAAWSSSNIVDIADASETAYVGVVAEADTEKSFTIPSEWLSNGGVVSFFLMADVPPYDALLTYIRSASAGPYIDTGFVPDTSSDVRAKTYNPANTGVVPFGVKGMLTFFSVWYSAPDPTTGAYYVSFFGASGSGTGGRGATVPRKAGPHEYKINATGAYIDGNLYQSFNSADFTESTTNSMTLFARKVDGETVGSQGDCTIYWAQLRQNGVLVHDYVPCRKNGTATLYDRVDGTLCAVKGSGSFTAGDALDPDARDCGGIESIAVVVLDDKLDIISSIDGIGSPSPEYGVTNGLAAGDSFTVSCGATPAINAAGTMQYYCTGWKLYDESNAVVSNGTETSFTYVHPTPAANRRLEWQWEVSAYSSTIAAGSGGSVSPSGTDWYAAGTPVTVTATPDTGKGFLRWTGTLPPGIDATSPTVTFAPTAQFDMTAVFAPVIYVKADATGADNGTSWTDAYTDVSNALAHASADDLVFIAKGRYVIKSLITVANAVSIYGGFAGQSMDETPETRDASANQTVFTSTSGSTYYWVHFDYNGAFGTTTTALSSNLLLGPDGVNLPPDFTGDYDGYYAQWTGNPAKYNALQLDAAVRLDGLTFAGFRDACTSSTGPSISLVTVNNASAVINNCTFIGNASQHGVIGLRAAAKVTNCRMFYNRGENLGSTFVSRTSYPTVSDCTIVSSSKMGGDFSHNVFNAWAGSFRVERCTITRCYSQINANGSNALGNGNIFGSMQSGTMSTFRDCVVSNNLAACDTSFGAPQFNAGYNNLKFERCHFVNNKSIVKPVVGRCYALFGQPKSNKAQSFEACSFEGNLIKAPQVAAASGSYALSLIGNYTGTGGFRLLNCSFLDNRAETVTKDGVTPVLCRGVASAIVANGNTPYACMANCTFAGPDNGLYDFIQFGAFGTTTNQIVNCVFTADGEAQPPFIYADKPDLVSLYDCTLQNKIITTDGSNYVENHEYDKIPLATNVVSAGYARFVLVPAAKTPGIRTTCDVATNTVDDTIVSLWNFRLNGASGWRSLLSGTAVSGDFSTKLVTDAFGASRPAGGFTRGASQRLTDTAENGATLVLRREPFTSGSFSGPAVQSVQDGDAAATVTASVVDASTTRFDGWYDENGDLFSSDPALSITSLSSPLTILTARFVSASVTLTFSLNGRGTFVSSGTDTATVSASAYEPFPDVPAFTMNEGWHFLGFDVPDTVPAESATYVADTVESTIRIKYVVPAGEQSGNESGDSWANASTNLAAAYADAGRYRGEVWLKTGTYPLRARIAMTANVTLRGGFLGTEQSADEADPAAHPTILTGDVSGNDYWQPNGSGGSLATHPIWRDGAFQSPNPGGADSYWAPSGGASEDTYSAFFRDSGTATNAAFDGITFTCFKGTAVSVSSSDNDGLAFRRCRFLACGTGKSARTVTVTGSSASFSDSLFDGCWWGVSAGGSPVRIVTFDNCAVSNTAYTSNSGGGAVFADGNAYVHIRNCVFSRNYCSHFGLEGGNAICLKNAANASVSNSIVDTVFAGNVSETIALGAVVVAGSARTFIERCRFTGNALRGLNVASGTYTGGYNEFAACLSVRTSGSAVARDCWFFGNTANDASGNAFMFSSVAHVCNGSLLMVNCTVDNSAATANTSAKCSVFAVEGGSLGLVNCLVDGSALTGENASEICVTAGTLTMVNTVLRNTDTGYAPFDVASAFVPRIANSVISGYDPSDLPSVGANGYLIDVVAGVPDVKAAKIGANGAVAIGIGSTPYGRHGRNVWLVGTNAYFYDGTAATWRSLPGGGTAASVSGLTTDSPLIPDAFAEPRVAGKVAPGPLNASGLGLLIFCR